MFQSRGPDDNPAGASERLSWQPDDDGLYRAPSSVHRAEPWNRERLHVQLQRTLSAGIETDGARAEQETARLLADEDREVLGCNLSAPRFAFDGVSAAGSEVRLRSHVKSKRRQLYASELFELRLDVTRVTLLRAPQGSPAFLDVLGSREAQAAAELQELFRRYRQEAETDVTSQLDGRLDALIEHGQLLRQAFLQEGRGAEANGAAREAYQKHVEERRKIRARRDERENRLEALCRSLYQKWKELRQIRHDQGFVSTPWRLRAQPEDHDAEVDMHRRSRNLEAEVEENAFLQGATDTDRVRASAEHRWDLSKRPPGAQSFHFEVFAGETITPMETLRARWREELSEDMAEEIKRRRLARRVRVRVVCCIGDRIVGTSPAFRIHWETWSTASVAQLDASSAHGSCSLAPLHSFDIAVHMMPQAVSLTVYVSNRGWWGPLLTPWRSQWHPTTEMEVDVPDREGRRVTHAAVLDQVLRFGPLVAGGADGGDADFEGEDTFSGEISARVSWPGDGRDSGFVVPPPRPPTLDNDPGKRVAVQSCLPCRSSGGPGGSASPGRRRSSDGNAAAAQTVMDARLAGLRYDPQDPENARMLMESPAPKALPGYDVARLGLENCMLGKKDVADLSRSGRVQRLLTRAEREGIDIERMLVPAFDREVRKDDDADEEPEGQGSEQRRLAQALRLETDSQRDLLRRVRARVRKTAQLRTHQSYESIVREHGQQEVEEGNFLESIEQFLRIFEPHRALRPRGGRRKQEVTTHSVRIHASVAKVYHAPVRSEDPQGGSSSAAFPAAAATLGAGGFLLGARHPGATFSQGHGSLGSSFPGSSLPGGALGSLQSIPGGGGVGLTAGAGMGLGTGADAGAGAGLSLAQPLAPLHVFGSHANELPAGLLPAIVVQMSITDMAGQVIRRWTRPVSSSSDPDVNQMMALTIKLPDAKEILQDAFEGFRGTLAFTVFDDVTIRSPERGGETRLRHQRRQLGRFELPWSTLYHAPKCSVKGHFRVAQPLVTCGYRGAPSSSTRPSSYGALDANIAEAATAAAGSAGVAVDRPEPEPMYISLDITLDPELVPPQRVQPNIVRGKEPSVLLKRVQEWLDYFKKDKDKKVLALGTDLDGRSRLVCRFVRPQRPPDHIRPDDAFAIEAAARYVSLIPFLADSDMFPQLNDIWCTDQEFLNFQCGDWEEHAILLCNYFNYIDNYRKEFVLGYGTSNVKSYCVKCDGLPEGEIWMVMRRDCDTGNCEFWHAVRGECFFVPRWKPPTFMERLCPHRAHRDLPPPSQSSAADGGAPAADGGAPTTTATAGGSPSAVLQATPFAPVQRVHVVFDSDNVWANLQRPGGRDSTAVLHNMSFDLEDRACWKPLFAGGRDELKRLSMAGQRAQAPPPSLLPSLRRAPSSAAAVNSSLAAAAAATTATAGGAGKGSTSENPWFEDPSQALKYEAANDRHAEFLTHKLENQLQREILDHRAMGDVQRITKFNHVIADRLGELLTQLEVLSSCRRRCGSEAIFPLRSAAAPPVSLQAVQQRMQEIESDFQKMGLPGRCVFGVPFNHSYTEVLDRLLVKQIWEEVRDSRILEMGNESAEFAVKVRVFPYACRILSVWVFVAVATGGD